MLSSYISLHAITMWTKLIVHTGGSMLELGWSQNHHGLEKGIIIIYKIKIFF